MPQCEKQCPSVQEVSVDDQKLLIQMNYDHDTTLLETTSKLVPSKAVTPCTSSVLGCSHAQHASRIADGCLP